MDYTRIVGTCTPGQIERTALVADIHLNTHDLAEIDTNMRDAVAVGGPSPESV